MKEARQTLLKRLQEASEVFRVSLDREEILRESLRSLTPEPFSEARIYLRQNGRFVETLASFKGKIHRPRNPQVVEADWLAEIPLYRPVLASPSMRKDLGMKTPHVLVTLIGSEKTPLGLLAVGAQGPLDPGEDALPTFASQLSLALSRALLKEELERRKEELEATNRRMREYQRTIREYELEAARGESLALLKDEDLRDALIILGAMVHDLMEQVDPSHPNFPYYQAIQEEYQRLERRMREILQGIRTQVLRKASPHDLNALILRKLRRIERIFPAAKVHLTLRLSGEPLYALVNKKLFYDCLESLIHNALEAMEGKGGSLEIRTSREGSWAVLRVRDSGKGIPPEILEKVRAPFFTTKPGGTGLGLYNCDRMMRSLGGQMEIRSKVGEGTEVVLYFPVAGEREQ